ncbi:unnamed protein product [Linum trigynum]|uniref:MSP domain-containing protein n=1 Tax=Linum trigynum TaxID=586398 RepID=A0AAV2DNY8_9ROSI
MAEQLVEISDTEVRIEFTLNSKCRANVTMKSLSPTAPIAFKVQTSSPHKFLVSPPTGLIPPLSSTTFRVVLKPQTHYPSSFPRSHSDRILIKTAPYHSDSAADSEFLSQWFSSLPSTVDFKLRVAFVGASLLRHAVGCGDVDSARNIIKRQRSVLSELSRGESESLLRVAAELVNPDNMVNLLLESGLKVEPVEADADSEWKSKGWNELHVVAASDRMQEVSDLVKRVSDVDHRDKEGRTPLYIAAANGNRRMVETLIEFGADPTAADYCGRSAVDVARDNGHEEVLKALERGEMVLTAARRGEFQLLESLLRRGAAVNYRDQYGLTALHAAAIKGLEKTVALLLKFEADIESRDNDGHTPLHLAAVAGGVETVEALVKRGADVNAVSNGGSTPLSIARALLHDDVVQALINKPGM